MALLFFFFQLCIAQVYIWLSQPLIIGSGRAYLNSICNSNYPNSKALLCTNTTDILQDFSETYDVFTRNAAGDNWNTLTPVATAGNVFRTLFDNSTASTTALLGTAIRAFDGSDGTDLTVGTGCFRDGKRITGSLCGGVFDNATDYTAIGSAGTLTSDWLCVSAGLRCNLTYRMYCIGGTYATAPTAAPTVAPTPAPVTKAPSAAAMTMAPTEPPTALPTVSPTTSRPTLVPTKAPTCATCTTTITPGSNSSNTTVVVGPPGGGVVVTVPPTAIPNCSNCSVLIVLTPTPSGPRGGSGIISIDVIDDGLMRDNVTLNVPISFLMPYSPDLAQCGRPVSADCVWWDGSHWLKSGCTSEAKDTGTLCTCTHLTDFAVLLDESTPFSCVREGSVEVYYAFAACYAAVFVYCALAVGHLLRSSKQSRSAMLWQHVLIGLIAVLRILSCLSSAKVFGDALGLNAFVAAAPYPLEYLLFTKFASTWAGVVHFSMLGSEARWLKIRPLFYGINVIGTGLAVALFVLFYVQASFESALAGTIVLASLYLALAAVFNVYATLLTKELTKAKTTSSAAARRNGCCEVSGKIRWVGRCATVCFVVQAVCDVLSMVTPIEQLVGWTAVFLLFNVLALLCILAVYNAAVLKANKTVSHHDGSSTGSVRTASSRGTEMSPI